MKLELKHLVGYLPYRLKIKTTSTNYKETYTLISLDVFGFGFKEGELFLRRCKPILRPLSDLTRKELEDAGFSDHIDYLTYENKGVEWTLKAPYTHIKYLLSKHYDVYGLIPAGLAININTLQE